MSYDQFVGVSIFAISLLSMAIARERFSRSGDLEPLRVGPEYYCMPADARSYKKTRIFTSDSIPNALKKIIILQLECGD